MTGPSRPRVVLVEAGTLLWFGIVVILFMLGVFGPGPVDYLLSLFIGAWTLPVLLGIIVLRALVQLAASEPRPVKWKPLAIGSAVALVVTGAWVAHRGVITPWTPTVKEAAPACRALESAGLDRYWPVAERRNATDLEELCTWFGGTTDRVDAIVQVHRTSTGFSPIANATLSFGSKRRGRDTSRALRIYDDGFVSRDGREVLVAARRANVTVSVSFERDQGDPEAAATELVRAMLATLRPT